MRCSCLRPTLAAILVAVLTSCSGSEFAQLGSDFGDHIARQFGVDPENVEAPDAVPNRARALARGANQLVATAVWEGTRKIGASNCTGVRCTWPDVDGRPGRAFAQMIARDGRKLSTAPLANGPTDFTYRPDFDRRTSGNWTRYSVAGIAEEDNWVEGPDSAIFAFAGGVRTGSRPTATATWTGPARAVATAHAVGGPVAGTRLFGDAALKWTTSAPSTVDLDIRNLRNGSEAWPDPGLTFEDVPLNTAGSFVLNVGDRRVRGAFQGPKHAEAAGVFETPALVGSFIGKRP